MALRNLLFFLLFVFVTIFFISCKEESTVKDCSRYRNGAFYYKLRNPEGEVIVQVKRTGNIQREIISSTGDMGVFEVRWNNSCTYVLSFVYLKSKFGYKDSIQSVAKGLKVEATILHGTDDYYVYSSVDSRVGRVIRDTAWLVK